VIADIPPKSKLEQEEIFGPVLAVIKSKNFDHALEIANDTEFGLTGAVFTKSRDRIDRAVREFHVGNLYINRKCTGAMVGRIPSVDSICLGRIPSLAAPIICICSRRASRWRKKSAKRVTVIAKEKKNKRQQKKRAALGRPFLMDRNVPRARLPPAVAAHSPQLWLRRPRSVSVMNREQR